MFSSTVLVHITVEMYSHILYVQYLKVQQYYVSNYTVE